jgi:hypothetical protein
VTGRGQKSRAGGGSLTPRLQSQLSVATTPAAQNAARSTRDCSATVLANRVSYDVALLFEPRARRFASAKKIPARKGGQSSLTVLSPLLSPLFRDFADWRPGERYSSRGAGRTKFRAVRCGRNRDGTE